MSARQTILLRLTGDDAIVEVVNALAAIVERLIDRLDVIEDYLGIDDDDLRPDLVDVHVSENCL